MTPQELAETFIAAGFDTPEKVTALLNAAGRMVALREVDLKIEALGQETADAMYPINQKRAALQTQRNAIIAQMA